MATRFFYREDYFAFVAGVFILGGLVGIPIIYYSVVKISYTTSLPWSLASCAVLVFAFRRNGTPSWLRLILGFFAFTLAAQTYSHQTGEPNLAFSGALGFLFLVICGRFAAAIAAMVRDAPPPTH